MKKSIFRKYDIRGKYGIDLDENDFKKIGKSIGVNIKKIAVGCDTRKTSEKLKQSLIEGFSSSGDLVHDAGKTHMGSLFYYGQKNNMPIAYITASHLSHKWTGIKIFHPNGSGFSKSDFEKIIKNLEIKPTGSSCKIEKLPTNKLIQEYIDFIVLKFSNDFKDMERKKIVIDCSNGAASLIAEELFTKLGFDVDVLNNNSDQDETVYSEENIEKLKTIEKYIGIYFDSDVDRMIIVDSKSSILSAEQSGFIILKHLEEGPISVTMDCSSNVEDFAAKMKRKVYREKIGHNFIAENVMKNKSVIGIEASSHFIVPSVINFNDAIATSVIFLSSAEKSTESINELASQVISYPSSKYDFNVKEQDKFLIMDKIKEYFKDSNSDLKDGIKVIYDSHWFLIRPSNTSGIIRLVVEAKNKEKLNTERDFLCGKIQDIISKF